MESSEEEDDFPSIETITPQSRVDSLFQSHTEKGIRQICCELLELKDAVENLCGNSRTKYLAFLRISEEVVEMKHELSELQKHISSQGILVQDLMTGVCLQLDEWKKSDLKEGEDAKEMQSSKDRDPLLDETEESKMDILENIDILLAEHRVEEAVEAIIAEEKTTAELKSSSEALSAGSNSYRSAFLERKAMVEEQLVEIAKQPLIRLLELKKALVGLIKIGKGPSAHQYLLKWFGSYLQKRIEVFLPSCSLCPRTFAATLAKLMFSAISMATRESGSVFGDDPVYTNRVVQWAEWEIEYFVRLVKENAPSSETICALHAASICVQAGLTYCTVLEPQGLKLSKLLLVLLRPYIDEVLELNFRRARKTVLDLEEGDENLPMAPRFVSPLSAFPTSSENPLSDSGLKFMYIIDEILEQLTPLAILHFGGNVLNRISQLFDKYVDALNKALPGPSDDDSLTELKVVLPFRAETDSEQLSLLGMAYTIADELLPDAISSLWNPHIESKEPRSEPNESSASTPAKSAELKELKRHLHHSFDKLRDHFCRQYVLSFIYSREGKTRLDAQVYLSENMEDLYQDSVPLPSLPFQALFARLQQFATVAGDILVGKEKIQKNLLARLTETVVMWLSDEQEFWGVFEDESSAIQAIGLRQLILDMHFTVEIARFAGYSSRHVHQIASAIIARAIRTFAARGIDPQSSLPEDEWFVETAKSAIHRLMGPSGSDTSDIEEGHIIMHDEILSESDDSGSSVLSDDESTESFASASMGELESPMFTDQEN
ncbi:hypothetical protein SAY86_001243 [Trapa natans]|uniref:Exocyst component Exo84 C-terminal domain-containing protein n=1 Tax=Trapa natans TaxID=22666 RepID=A0AAN7MBP5_TRANT|nr:hypothetical protein SAY86_001243 [Trapa natans]